MAGFRAGPDRRTFWSDIQKSPGTSFWKTSKVEIGCFAFNVFRFCKYLFFLWAFSHTLMNTQRGIYDCGGVTVTTALPARSKN